MAEKCWGPVRRVVVNRLAIVVVMVVMMVMVVFDLLDHNSDNHIREAITNLKKKL